MRQDFKKPDFKALISTSTRETAETHISCLILYLIDQPHDVALPYVRF